MKTTVLSFGLLTLLAGAAPASEPALTAGDGDRPRVMILGTFHFDGSSGDVIDVSMGDVLTPGRQSEIERVVELLAGFAPTKVMVEALPEHQAALDELYRAYRAGERELAANERQQLGMRLAARLGHEGVLAVDARQDMDFGRMMAAGEAAGQARRLEDFRATLAEVEATIRREHGPGRSILDALRFHNSDWGHAGNSLYLKLAVLGTTADPAGAEVVGGWYARNLKIFANIARAIEGPEDRALVVIGSGHLAQLADFFQQSAEHEWVSALEVLGPPRD